MTSIVNLQSSVFNPPVSVLLFDFGGTLDADGVAWKERFFRLWRDEGENTAREAFDRAFYAADDALIGTLPATLPLAETAGRLARGIGEGLGTRDASLPERVAARFTAESRQSLSRSAAMLGRLSARYRLGVVSNFYGNLEAVCREAGLGRHLSATVDSADVRCAKPDPAIFRAALEKLSAAAAEAVFIGDSPARDMAGARGVGMRHVFVAGEAFNGFRPCCPGDARIRGVEELAEMFL
jgi:HAD superfamily hydrolase (TIGR01509 family)